MQHYVGIAEMKVSCSEGDVLIAANLASCVGIAVYDPRLKVGGMIHCLLPLSSADPQKAEQNPCTYVDTGLVLLLEKILKFGSPKKELVIAIAGGANINFKNEIFEIGKKNYTVVRKVLWKNNLLVKAECVGGEEPRTLVMEISTGAVSMKCKSEIITLV